MNKNCLSPSKGEKNQVKLNSKKRNSKKQTCKQKRRSIGVCYSQLRLSSTNTMNVNYFYRVLNKTPLSLLKKLNCKPSRLRKLKK